MIRFLLGHQSFIDGTTCLWATLLLVQPPNWVPGISILDGFVCHAWNGQFIYWCSVLISGLYLNPHFYVMTSICSFLGHCHPCFALLVMSPLGFTPTIDHSGCLLCRVHRRDCSNATTAKILVATRLL